MYERVNAFAGKENVWMCCGVTWLVTCHTLDYLIVYQQWYILYQ